MQDSRRNARQQDCSAAIRRMIASVLRLDIDPPTDLPA
ncbi:hypothetical protein C7S13_5147 [Burkholderia cepacia]|nr:hypothetical protein [Burkholderia cepacia]